MFMQKLRQNRLPLTLALVLIVLLGLLRAGMMDHLSARMLNKNLLEENARYLDESAKQARENVIKLAEIYALLQVFQSSEIGVSFIIKFQVKVGETVAAFSNMLERGIIISFVAAAAAEILKAIDEIASDVSPHLFRLALLVTASYLILFSISRQHHLTVLAHFGAEVCIVLFLTTYLLIPYSIHLSGWAGHEITAVLKEQSTLHLNHLHTEVTKTHRKMGLKDRAEHAVHELEKVIIDIAKKIDRTSVFVVRHVAAALIEGLILPLGIFLALLWVQRQLVARIWERIQQLQAES